MLREISIYSFWGKRVQSFHEIPYMVILFPRKEKAKNLNLFISEIIRRNCIKISGMLCLIGMSHFAQKSME